MLLNTCSKVRSWWQKVEAMPGRTSLGKAHLVMLSGSALPALEPGALRPTLSSSLLQATKQQLQAGCQVSHAGYPDTPDLTWRSCIQQWQQEAESVRPTATGIVCIVTSLY